MIMAGFQNLLKVLKKLFRGEGITIRRRGLRALANSTRWHGDSRKATGIKSTRASSIPPVSRVPSESIADAIAYLHANSDTGPSDDDIVIELQDSENPGCPQLAELHGDEKKAVEIECECAMKIKRVFEVLNTPATCSNFEDYRKLVMARAKNAPHSQANEATFSWFKEENRQGAWRPNESTYCRANGNELQRYYGTTVSCSLSSSSSPSGSSSSIELCEMDQCCLCSVLKQGLGQEVTTSTAVAAKLKNRDVSLCRGKKKAVIVCRVIAGKVKPRLRAHRKIVPADQFEQFDSAALDDDDLSVKDSRAILPSFVLIY